MSILRIISALFLFYLLRRLFSFLIKYGLKKSSSIHLNKTKSDKKDFIDVTFERKN